jgi:hypothetical protein
MWSMVLSIQTIKGENVNWYLVDKKKKIKEREV